MQCHFCYVQATYLLSLNKISALPSSQFLLQAHSSQPKHANILYPKKIGHQVTLYTAFLRNSDILTLAILPRPHAEFSMRLRHFDALVTSVRWSTAMSSRSAIVVDSLMGVIHYATIHYCPIIGA